MKKFLNIVLTFVLVLCAFSPFCFRDQGHNHGKRVRAEGETAKYYTVYDYASPKKVVFVKGEGICVDDEYLSEDNKLYRIVEVDNKSKTAKAEFICDEKLPEYDVKFKEEKNVASAESSKKKVGVYHTHNDESYYDPDKTDSVYGKGGIHDVGKAFVKQLENLGISVVYREDLHLPHNSGAYTRSQVTASSILNQGGIDALFDVHRDSVPRKEYFTTVNGENMSKVRMVVGSANQNYYENKEFAYSIKAYADKVYPGLIKDIYMGRGNYNQQLLSRGMLFEFGCENIEKSLAIKSTEPLSKVVDVVLYGSDGASKKSMTAVSSSSGKEAVITGIISKKSTASISFFWILLGSIGCYFAVLGIVCIFSKTARYKTSRFFKELFAFRKQ